MPVRPIPKHIDYRAAVEFAPTGVVLTDNTEPDNLIIFVNAAFTRMTGYTFDEAEGRNCRFFQGPGTYALSVIEMRNALSDKQESDIIAQVRADLTPAEDVMRQLLHPNVQSRHIWAD